jgi:hypothetical protein
VDSLDNLCLVYEVPFREEVLRIEYHVNGRALRLVFDIGTIYDIDWSPSHEWTDIFLRYRRIRLVRYENKAPIEGIDVALVHNFDAQVGNAPKGSAQAEDQSEPSAAAQVEPPNVHHVDTTPDDLDSVRFGFSVNPGGKVAVVHDRPLPGKVRSLMYDSMDCRLVLTFENGLTFSIEAGGFEAAETAVFHPVLERLSKVESVLLIRLDNGKPVEGYAVPLFQRAASLDA